MKTRITLAASAAIISMAVTYASMRMLRRRREENLPAIATEPDTMEAVRATPHKKLVAHKRHLN